MSCKVRLNDRTDGYSYQVGTGRNIRLNQDHDKEQYPLIVSFNTIDSFLRSNGVKNGEVEIDSNSLDVFYGYSGYGHEKVTAKLRSKFVNEWWNVDCPTLYRYTTNKDGGVNILGVPLLYFTDCLVEASYYGTYIDRTITEEEVLALTKGYEQTIIYREMMNVLKAKNVTKEQVDEMERFVVNYEKRIQKVIDNNKVAIMAHLFDSNVFDETGKERCFGLDCGFIYVYTTNQNYVQKKGLLKNIKQVPDWLNVRFPYKTQSLTVMKEQFRKIKEVVFVETGEELFCKTMLD